MKKSDIPTHIVQYRRDGEGWMQHKAWGTKDLFSLLSHLMKSGYTQFTINPFN